jgi:hypothetical protein
MIKCQDEQTVSDSQKPSNKQIFTAAKSDKKYHFFIYLFVNLMYNTMFYAQWERGDSFITWGDFIS